MAQTKQSARISEVPRIALNAEDAAAAIGIPLNTLHRLKNTGEIPFIELSRETFLFDPADLAAWRESRLAMADLKARIENCKHTGARIYFIQAGNSGPIKIGYTSKPIEKRLVGIQSSNHEQLRLLGSFPGDRGIEQTIHDSLRGSHIRGEWFDSTKEVFAELKKLEAMCQATEASV